MAVANGIEWEENGKDKIWTGVWGERMQMDIYNATVSLFRQIMQTVGHERVHTYTHKCSMHANSNREERVKQGI